MALSDDEVEIIMRYNKDELLLMLNDVDSIVRNVPEDSVFDIIETHDNVTVEVLKNSKTGEVSVGWHYSNPFDVDKTNSPSNKKILS